MGDESKGPRAVAAYPEKHPSYFPYADNRSWIVGRVCFQPSLTWLGICKTCAFITMSCVSSGLGLSDTTFIVMPPPFPRDSVKGAILYLCGEYELDLTWLDLPPLSRQEYGGGDFQAMRQRVQKIGTWRSENRTCCVAGAGREWKILVFGSKNQTQILKSRIFFL